MTKFLNFEIGDAYKSKLRSKLFQLYFSDPDKEYYLREIERLIHHPVQNVRRELIRLKKEGIFKSKKQGNLVYFSLNKDFPLYETLKELVSKTIGVEGKIKKTISKFKNIKRAFIFGSFAKNNAKSDSDIDLMLIGKADEDKLVVAVTRLERLFKREINYHLISENEWQVKSKKNSFIKSIINNPKIELL